MPHLRIETNLPRSRIPDDFLSATVDLIAKLLGKPPSYCVVSVLPDTLMSWGKGSDPCAIVRLMSIGGISDANNVKYSAALASHIEKSLGIAGNRQYIEFKDVPAANLGYESTTFGDLFK